MRIQSMFRDDINRKINGVVKVDQDETAVLVQELKEYVITRELKKHFITFFNNYNESFSEETADIGVWVSGFFGSGKSHFLKMLSYLLENREVDGVKTRHLHAHRPGYQGPYRYHPLQHRYRGLHQQGQNRRAARVCQDVL